MRRKKKGMPPQIMEVAFVLTFMFLILSTLANTTQQESREKTLPDIDLGKLKDPSQQGSSSVKSTVITIAEGPRFYIDNKEMPLSALVQELQRRNPPSVQLRGDQKVPYGEITKVIGACMEAGIYNVTLGYKTSS